jgi:hypothetical protein
MKHAVIAGRASFLAGRMMKKAYASASSPMEAVHLLEAILVISFVIAILQLTHTNSVYLENLSQRIKMEPTRSKQAEGISYKNVIANFNYSIIFTKFH